MPDNNHDDTIARYMEEIANMPIRQSILDKGKREREYNKEYEQKRTRQETLFRHERKLKREKLARERRQLKRDSENLLDKQDGI